MFSGTRPLSPRKSGQTEAQSFDTGTVAAFADHEGDAVNFKEYILVGIIRRVISQAYFAATTSADAEDVHTDPSSGWLLGQTFFQGSLRFIGKSQHTSSVERLCRSGENSVHALGAHPVAYGYHPLSVHGRHTFQSVLAP